MRTKRKMLILMFVAASSVIGSVYAQENYYDVSSGEGYGLRFKGSDYYKISMGNGASYHLAPTVTSYSIKSTMWDGAPYDRGWTWGQKDKTPVAALNTAGTLQLQNNLLVGNSVSIGSPSVTDEKLNVDGRIFLDQHSNGAGIHYRSNDNSTWFAGVNSSNNNFRIYNGRDLLSVHKDGNISIGSHQSYGYKLFVNGSGYFKSNLTVAGGAAFKADSWTTTSVYDDGRVGIGMLNGWDGFGAQLGIYNSHSKPATIMLQSGTNGNGTARFWIAGDENHLRFSAGAPVPNRGDVGTINICHNGNVGIGSDPEPKSGNMLDNIKLKINGSTKVNGKLDLVAQKMDYGLGVQIWTDRGNQQPIAVLDGRSNTAVFRVNGNGAVNAKYIYTTGVQVRADAMGIRWYDHVFNEDYDLMELNEVESFIKENKHLPSIPSQDDVNRDGVNLVEMDGLLLKKVEELTLYIIELQKEVETLKAENNE